MDASYSRVLGVMKVLYLYGTQRGRDETAISNALRELGHEVVNQSDRGLRVRQAKGYDLLLFNHSEKLDEIARVPIPKVFWCFDLILHDDFVPDTIDRRIKWATKATEICDVGFCTDGEWAEQHPDKITWLTQGAQDLVKKEHNKEHDILFAGSATSNSRKKFLEELKKEFPDQVKTVMGNKRVYGVDYAKLIARSKIVIAPDNPVKPNYWSNRIYQVLGYGGFLLHPYIEELTNQYQDGEEVVFYQRREELYLHIRNFLRMDAERNRIAINGLKRTQREHTYLHRCRELMCVVENHLSQAPTRIAN